MGSVDWDTEKHWPPRKKQVRRKKTPSSPRKKAGRPKNAISSSSHFFWMSDDFPLKPGETSYLLKNVLNFNRAVMERRVNTYYKENPKMEPILDKMAVWLE